MFIPDVVAEAPKAGLSGGKSAAPARQEGVTSLTARRLADISTTEEKSRILTGISELSLDVVFMINTKIKIARKDKISFLA